MPDAIPAVPFPRQLSKTTNNPQNSEFSEATPVLALKKLVSSLYREQNKIQNLLSSLGFALRSFHNLNQFLELTPLMAARVADAEGGALVLFEAKDQVNIEQLYCQDSQISQEIRQAFEPLTGRKVTAANHKTKSTQSLPVPSLSAFLDEQLKQYFQSRLQIFGTPILIKNVERGRLYVFSSDINYGWTQTRRKLAQLVADQTAVAIANNELTVKLRSKERQDRELEIASEIQVRLLPRQCPKIYGVKLAAHSKTANRVGGDYYDFIPSNYDQLRTYPDGTVEAQPCVPWSIVIGDVMGKGVPAGLIMTMTRGMLRAEVLNRHSPAQILQHLNRVMYADLENSHRFVTLFYSEYNPQTNTLSYTNAAHNPPLLWRAASNSIEKLDTQGMLLGLAPDSEYEDNQIQLESGDTIIYYTDGFTDAINQNGDRFDEENLTSAFHWACQHCNNPQAILDYLFNQVQKFTGSDNGKSDDMTLIVMEVV